MKEIDKDTLIENISIIIVVLIIVLGIAIPFLISEKRNIEKEITLKQIEVYGEPINLDKERSDNNGKYR